MAAEGCCRGYQRSNREVRVRLKGNRTNLVEWGNANRRNILKQVQTIKTNKQTYLELQSNRVRTEKPDK